MTETTHYDGCWDSGPRHYECAVLEVKRSRREWVGLTEDERVLITDVANDDLDAMILAEAKLKEKNGG